MYIRYSLLAWLQYIHTSIYIYIYCWYRYRSWTWWRECVWTWGIHCNFNGKYYFQHQHVLGPWFFFHWSKPMSSDSNGHVKNLGKIPIEYRRTIYDHIFEMDWNKQFFSFKQRLEDYFQIPTKLKIPVITLGVDVIFHELQFLSLGKVRSCQWPRFFYCPREAYQEDVR